MRAIIILTLVFALLASEGVCLADEGKGRIEDALLLLTARRDKEALLIFDEISASEPHNLDAIWGRAEILRREHNYRQAEELINQVLFSDPQHAPSLTSLAYIRYNDDRIPEALELIRQVFKNKNLSRQSKALAYLMLGAINSGRSSKGGVFAKLRYGTTIQGYFLKARELAPQMPEVHLGLGTFYLKAPAIAGGNLDKAITELELAVKLAPDFATANARLGQAYKRKGNLEKYNFYIKRARELDPQNEVLAELQAD